ncbi:unnamed protein product [Absidia cylindrospora]
MPPKSSAKKRKAPEPNQSTLDSFRLSQPSKSKAASHSRTQPRTSPPLHSPITQQIDHAESSNTNTNSRTQSTTINVTSLLGSFRRQALIDKIDVRNAKDMQSTELSETQLETTWTTLSNLVRSIVNSKPLETNLQIAYELCQTVCLHGKSKELYDHLEAILADHLQQEKDIIVESTANDTFLNILDSHWNIFCDHMMTIRNVFMELDRRFVVPKTSYTSVIDLGKQMFKKTIMEIPKVQSKTITCVLHLIQQDRNGMEVDLKLIQSITRMMLDLSLYADFFEPSFIKSTIEYYSAEATEKIHELSTTAYLQHAKDCVQQESDQRLTSYLDQSTKIPLTEAVADQLIYTKVDVILSQGFETMMEQDERKSIAILYHFLSPHDLISKLRTAFGNYIKNAGMELVKDPAKDQQMVTTLLQYKSKLDKTLKYSFDDDSSFSNTLKVNFEHFINSRKNKPAELIAKFIDSKLRSSSKQHGEEDMEKILDKVLILFRYLQDKDIFEAFYKRFLSKRLLLNRTISNDLEKHILYKFKSECGPEFTKDLENMFKDMEVSSDLNVTFKEYRQNVQEASLPLYVSVLAQGVWPTYPATEIMLPIDMMSLLEAYQSFYNKKFKGRKLAWRSSLGSCVLKSHFPKATKELSVSLFQAVVLLLFNDKSTMTYKDIALATNLDDKELKKVMQSLSCGKYKLLIKEPQNNNVSDNDIFEYNADFTASAVRLKINSIQQEQSTEERKETQTKVIVDRQHQLEAAVVRIMKSKKQMTHIALVKELFEQLKFPIDATDIKKRIESLIDR